MPTNDALRAARPPIVSTLIAVAGGNANGATFRLKERLGPANRSDHRRPPSAARESSRAVCKLPAQTPGRCAIAQE